MIYRITNDGHKHAHLVKNREELMALRNSKENLENLAKARKGDAGAKAHLVQFAYNLGHVDGALAGCKSIGSYFFHDVDQYEAPLPSSPKGEGNTSEEIVKMILSKKDEIGLMMLERSASGGYHLVCRRVPGTTILENQVRIATILQIEMDTSTKDLQRVVFSTSGNPDDLIYLDDELFTEPMTPEECVQEYNRLKVRVMQRKENVPAGAKKANKHYRPWLESPLPAPPLGECLQAKNPNRSDSALAPFEESFQAKNTDENNTPPKGEMEGAESARVKFIYKGVMKEKGL